MKIRAILSGAGMIAVTAAILAAQAPVQAGPAISADTMVLATVPGSVARNLSDRLRRDLAPGPSPISGKARPQPVRYTPDPARHLI